MFKKQKQTPQKRLAEPFQPKKLNPQLSKAEKRKRIVTKSQSHNT